MSRFKVDEPLFVSEAELQKLVLGTSRRDWAPVAKALEREGLPRVDPLMGGRYWRAVVAFFDQRHGIDDRFLGGVDGKENWGDR